MRRSRFPLFGLVGLCVTLGSVTSSLLASERFDQVAVTTLPAGATVIVDGEVGGCTPLVVSLSRQFVHVITVELEGYRPLTTEVRPEVDWTELSRNALGGALTGLLGGAVDLATGEARQLTPSEIQWTLERVHEVQGAILPVVATRFCGL
jgi:hypothetical protein